VNTTKTKTNQSSLRRLIQRAQAVAFNHTAQLILITLLSVTTAAAQARSVRPRANRSFQTMTVNLYVGGGTGRVLALAPSDPGYITNLVATVTGIYYEIAASQPVVRLQRVADEIAARHPDIVSVQEASLIRVQSPGDLVLGGTTRATNVVFDYLQILVDSLATRGVYYAVVASTDELDVELPMLNLQTGSIDDARLTDRDAILVRTDLPRGELLVRHPRSGNFTNIIRLPSVGLSVPRGWCSVDVILRGQVFRYICTHLEEETAPQLQILQAKELLEGPARSNLPVIIGGDFNSDPLHRDGSLAYDVFAAHFKDAWTLVHPADFAGGLTWGHDEFLADPSTAFDRRIDLVFFRGGRFTAWQAEVRDLTLDRTRPPLWASDHAAVVVTFAPRGSRH